MSEQTKKSEQLYAMRHSLAHIMAAAVQQLWPNAKFGVGPVIENGFYYDIDLGDTTLSPDDLARIEAEMTKIIKANPKFERSERSLEEAVAWAKASQQPYKAELLADLAKHGTTAVKDIDSDELVAKNVDKITTVSFFKLGKFEDLCRGPHVTEAKSVGAFKLDRIAGAYWRGNEKNPQLQRIYGVAFATAKELAKYYQLQAEARLRDHRALGERLAIFSLSAEVGAGLPLILPAGESIKHTLMEYMRGVESQAGYRYVSTPLLASEKLYAKSGHSQYFTEEMYGLSDEEGNKFYIKPMNCPHHHQIYSQLVTSYRDLPLKLAEAGAVYRNELSGVLSGLIRVRGPITQNDAHIYTTPVQLEEEFSKVLKIFSDVYRELGIKDYWFRLSLPDFSSPKFGGDKKLWAETSDGIRSAMKKFGAKFEEAEGEAAFYGPKVDVQIKNVLGKEDTIATMQVDVLVPGRMGLNYVDEAGDKQTPIIIHHAILGSYERFMAFLLEQTRGNLPVWLAPEQVRLITVNDAKETLAYARKIGDEMLAQGIRSNIDSSNETVGKKIRQAEVMKVPYTLVIGDKEIKTGKFVPRVRGDIHLKHHDQPMGLEQFIKTVLNEAKSHVHTSSL